MNVRYFKRKRSSADTDEYFTGYDTVKNECDNYLDQFKGKSIYCNCDSVESNFVKYFQELEDKGWIRSLIYSSLDDGISFDSDTAISYLDRCDIVVTNPPFSRIEDMIKLILAHGKRFLLIGPNTLFTKKDMFPLVQSNEMHTGCTLFNGAMPHFKVPDTYDTTIGKTVRMEDGVYRQVNSICWWTNLYRSPREHLTFTERYDPQKCPRFDNYDAVNTDSIRMIPGDYRGVIGCPIGIINAYNPEQIEIVGMPDRLNTYGLKTKEYTKADSPKYNDLNRSAVVKVNGELVPKFTRIFIRIK